MAKSTIDDLLACYRLAGKLGRAHKTKLIALLQEDVTEKKSQTIQPVKREKREKREEPPQ